MFSTGFQFLCYPAAGYSCILSLAYRYERGINPKSSSNSPQESKKYNSQNVYWPEPVMSSCVFVGSRSPCNSSFKYLHQHLPDGSAGWRNLD